MYQWRPGQSSFFITNGLVFERKKPVTAFVWLSQASKRPTSTRTERWVTGRTNELWEDDKQESGLELLEWRQPFHKRSDGGSLTFNRCFSCCCEVNTTTSTTPFRASFSEIAIKQSRWQHNFFTHFQKDKNYEVCRRTKITTATCKRDPVNPADRLHVADKIGDLVTADHKVLNEEQASGLQKQIFCRCPRSGNAMDSELPAQKKSQPHKPRGALKTPRHQTKNHLHRQFFGVHQSISGIELES